MATSAQFTAVTSPDNVHQVIFDMVQQLSTLWYAASDPDQKDTLYTLMDKLNERSLVLLEQEIDTNSVQLADAINLLKNSSTMAKQAVGDVQKTSQVINGVAQAISLLDQVLKVAGPLIA